MNLDDKRRVVHQFAAQLQDNHGQRLTEALIQGLATKLELMLPDQAPEAPTPDLIPTTPPKAK